MVETLIDADGTTIATRTSGSEWVCAFSGRPLGAKDQRDFSAFAAGEIDAIKLGMQNARIARA
jgi:hypothetical protein